MNIIAKVGTRNPGIMYEDRPTVKVVIKNRENKVLVINAGLLPGGGVDLGEDNHQAIERELKEELGMSVVNVAQLGTVVQYRDFLQKRYIVDGYVANFLSEDDYRDPQDAGEAQFTHQWLSKSDALQLVSESIAKFDGVDIAGDSEQGRLFNLITTCELLSAL